MRLGGALDQAVRDGAFLAVLFHPFLADTGDRLDAMRAVLSDVHAVAAAGAVWCAPLREIAAWIRALG